jgi:hypothetical protein
MRVMQNLRGFKETERLSAPYAKADLRNAVDQVCEAQGIDKPDRLCGRYRNLLICFIRDNFPAFPQGFPPIPLFRRALPKTCDFAEQLVREEPETQQIDAVDQNSGNEDPPLMVSDEFNPGLDTNWSEFQVDYFIDY